MYGYPWAAEMRAADPIASLGPGIAAGGCSRSLPNPYAPAVNGSLFASVPECRYGAGRRPLPGLCSSTGRRLGLRAAGGGFCFAIAV